MRFRSTRSIRAGSRYRGARGSSRRRHSVSINGLLRLDNYFIGTGYFNGLTADYGVALMTFFVLQVLLVERFLSRGRFLRSFRVHAFW